MLIHIGDRRDMFLGMTVQKEEHNYLTELLRVRCA